MINQRPLLERLILNWVFLIQRNPLKVIAGVLILTVASVFFIKDNLGMSTSTKNMLSEELPWRQLDITYEKLFPQFLNNVLIVIDAKTSDQAIDSAIEITGALNRNKQHIDDIYYPLLQPYFRQSAFLFMAPDELQDLADQLAQIQPFLGTLLEDKNLRGLFDMLGDALSAKQDGEDIDIKPLIEELNLAFQDEQHHVSWQKLISADKETKPLYREFIDVRVKDVDEVLTGETVLTHLREVISTTKAYQDKTVTIRLTGGKALSNEELKSVSKANIQAVIISLILVATILLVGLGSGWLVVSSLMTLLAGLVFTTAFAAATVGELNLISVAFAVLYIGLGIDFAIHLTLRYREVLLSDNENVDPLRLAVKHIYRSLLLCTVSTAISFYSFIPTDYQGVAELGWIAGSGMLISITFTLTLLPALLSLRPQAFVGKQPAAHGGLFISLLGRLAYRYPKQILFIALVLSIAILSQIDRIRFDNNTLNLQDPENESVQTFRDLLNDHNTTPWHSVSLKKGREVSAQAVQRFERLPLVEEVIWLEDLVPEEQEDKLFIIDEMNLFMGPLQPETDSPAPTDNEYLQSATRLVALLDGYADPELDQALQQLGNHLSRLLEKTPEQQRLRSLEERVLANLDGRLDSLSDALVAEEVALEQIPAAIRARWLNNDHYRLQINPKEDLNDNAAMKEFVELLQSHDDQVIGSPVINIEAGKSVVAAFRSAFTYALLAIAILLIILIPAKSDVVIILVALLLGSVFTCGFMLLFNMPLNFANIIGLPLLLGIGVDSGIHLTDRFRQEQQYDINIYTTSSARGIVVSSLTTICSIGSLAFSSHAGTAGMGLLLVAGLVSMMIATMIVLPAFVVWQRSLGSRR